MSNWIHTKLKGNCTQIAQTSNECSNTGITFDVTINNESVDDIAAFQIQSIETDVRN